ncbi:MAG: hypothetical protein WC835_01910 [Candidatus Paceibacterota bacterium]|jgi:hypothetical protein
MNHKGFITLLLLTLVTALLIGGVIYAYVRNRQGNQPAVAVADAATLTTSIVPASTSQTSNWKTYSNTKFNYSIRYPDDFTLVFESPYEYPSYLIMAFGSSYAPITSNQSPSFSLVNFKFDSDTFKGFSYGQIMIKGDIYADLKCHGELIGDSNAQETTIDGVRMMKYIYRANGEREETSFYGYFFQKAGDNNCFLIRLYPYPTDTDLLQKFDQIFSTLKFSS